MIHAIKIKNVKFSYKPYYILVCWDVEKSIVKRTPQISSNVD